jgi:hypothetical protein
MTRQAIKFKKLKKFISDPNMFFYDMFRKRVFKNVSPVAIEKTASTAVTSATSAPSVDLLEINRLGLVNYIRKNLNAGIGAEDGQDPNSLLIWSGYLNGLIGFISGLRETTPTNVTIYTLGGGVSVTCSAGEKFDSKAISRALSSRPDFVVELCNPLGELYVLHFYLYDLAPTGEATIRSNRAWVRRFPIGDFDLIFNRASDNYTISPVDAVYTWVNHADEEWQRLWVESFPDEAFDPDRYTSNDELRYSLRSLNKYAPWLNKIYIVSNCSRPNWLDHDDRIIWINHDSIFPEKEALPTFNSHAIEACLHRIEGLSEHFIYLNDDFILSQPCIPSDFFDEIGRSMAYFEPYGMVSDNAQPEAPDYLVAAQNSRELLARDFPNYQARTLHRHVPYCLKKSVLENIESKYPWAFAKTRQAKRRSEDDINLTSFLYHHFAFASGQAVKADAAGLIVRPNNVNAVTSKDIFKYKLLCFNDGNGSADDTEYKIKTQKFFDTRLHQRAPWERSYNID